MRSWRIGNPHLSKRQNEARLACLAAIDMMGRVETLVRKFSNCSDRFQTSRCDVRSGIANGEALVGSIGSELMMSYTGVVDTEESASRPRLRAKRSGSIADVGGHLRGDAGAIEARGVDRLVVVRRPRPGRVRNHGRTRTDAETIALWSAFREIAACRAVRYEEARRAINAALEASPRWSWMTLWNRIEEFPEKPIDSRLETIMAS